MIKLLILSAVFLLFFNAVPSVAEIRELPEYLELSTVDLRDLKYKNIGVKINGSIDVSAVRENDNFGTCKIRFDLFNLIPIKTISAKINSERKVYVGGFPTGLSMKVDGVVVVQSVEIDTFAGKVRPNSGVIDGDIIIEMNGKKILYVRDIIEIMQNFSENDRIVEMIVLRNGSERKVTAYPVIEELTGYYRLGLAVKETVEGIGTVSYIKPNGRFGCLGHPISGNDNNSVLPCYDGKVYDCSILGYSKAGRGAPGELKGTFLNISHPIGRIEANSPYGVYGTVDKTLAAELMDVGSRHLVKMGKAHILTTINDTPTYYEIEIIKIAAQNSPSEKGLIIRVTDKNLLAQTGGILQGMSGSPIIQDNKVIGAVTHVFVGDATKGYGIFLDWMYEN